MTTSASTTVITKHGNIITNEGVEPTAREILVATAIRAARKQNIAARAARNSR